MVKLTSDVWKKSKSANMLTFLNFTSSVDGLSKNLDFSAKFWVKPVIDFRMSRFKKNYLSLNDQKLVKPFDIMFCDNLRLFSHSKKNAVEFAAN